MGKCWGITGSLKTRLKRCEREARERFFCHQHRTQPIWLGFLILLAIITLVGTAVDISSIKSFLSPDTESQLVHQTKPAIPEPIIKCYLQHPIITEESPLRINKRNPDAIIYNDGAVSVVSLRIDSWALGYDRSKGQISVGAKYGQSPHGHLFSVDELEPSENIKKSIPGISKSDIAIYLFDLAYNRKEDLKEYEHREMFFVEMGVIYTESEFESHKNYENLTEGIKKFINKANSLPKTYFRGTDQHAWIVDADPRYDIKLNEDGSASLKLRFFDIEQLKNHYSSISRPYLRMTPVKFTDTNTYLKAKFEQNTGTVNFVYEVINEGKEIAIDIQQVHFEKSQISADAAPSRPQAETISILPGQKKYLNQEVLLKRDPSKASKLPDTASGGINFEESPLLIKTTIFYSSKEGVKKQYKTTVTHEFRKTSVKLIDSEFE